MERLTFKKPDQIIDLILNSNKKLIAVA